MSHDHSPAGAARRTSTWQALVHGRTLLSIGMFSIFAVMVWIASGYPWQASMLPLVIGVPGMVLSALQVVLDVRDFHRQEGRIDPRTEFEKYMDEIAAHTHGKVRMEVAQGTQLQTLVEERPEVLARSRGQREIILFAYFFLLVGLVLLFGFWLGYPIFLAAFLRFYSRESWRLTLALTGGSWALLYLLLVVALRQILFEGFVTLYVLDAWFPE